MLVERTVTTHAGVATVKYGRLGEIIGISEPIPVLRYTQW
jgi:hypothetical protein